MEELITATTIGIVALLLFNRQNVENFTSGSGFEMSNNSFPLFLNMYPIDLSTDFGLFNMIQSLKYKIFKPLSRGIYSDSGFGVISTGPSLNPVILVPGLGISKIEGIWNKDSGGDVKSLDLYKNFETSEKWSCRTVQQNWSTLWFPYNPLDQIPETANLSNYCWAENVVVGYDKKIITDADGVYTRVPNFGSVDFTDSSYMNAMIKALEAIGYVQGSTLFAAGYDFRKIASSDILDLYCKEFQGLVENMVHHNQGQKAFLVGHSLGSCLTNYFLATRPKKWKDTYVKAFVTISGGFGGCPKALRTLLSGTDVTNKNEQNLLRLVTKNYTGMQWLLPSPKIYGDMPLVTYKQMKFTAKDIPNLLKSAGYVDSAEIYTNVVLPVQNKSMEPPNVTTYVFAGDNVQTESSYLYRNTLTEDPIKNYPSYNTNLPYNNQFDYARNFNGDGTMPKFALQYPLHWSNSQKEPVYYRFYPQMEHKNILDLKDPIRDLLAIIAGD